jgi:uncharacterized protein YjbI with pentapeptide repeats
LSELNLRDVKFNGANLRGANLRGANLRGADVKKVIYDDKTKLPFSDEEARKRGMLKIAPQANLTGADLSGLNLRDVDLSGANLTGASLKDTKLLGACYNQSTTFPKNFQPEKRGMILGTNDGQCPNPQE